MAALRARGRVSITIEKRLPVQGGLGAGSGNAVAALIALERALKKKLSGAEELQNRGRGGFWISRCCFWSAGLCSWVGHGEEVYPLPDLPATICVVATPEIGVSTPKAFGDWDAMVAREGHTISVVAIIISGKGTTSVGPIQGQNVSRALAAGGTCRAWLGLGRSETRPLHGRRSSPPLPN